MNIVMEKESEDSDNSASSPRIVMMNPKEISPSLFGIDVNLPTSAEEDLALRESIARDGVQVPITAGWVGKRRGKPTVVKGTRRHRLALELGLAEVPVELKEYDSAATMRQDAIHDNLVRRQLSKIVRAEQANILWGLYESAEDKKTMAAQGLSPRKRAAIAGGLSEGTLAAYRYVLDSGNVNLIEQMQSGKLAIDAAYRQAKKETEGGKAQGDEKELPARMKRLEADLAALVNALKSLSDTTARTEAVMGTLAKSRKDDRERMLKKMRAAASFIATAEVEQTLSKLRTMLSREPGANSEPTGDGTTQSLANTVE